MSNVVNDDMKDWNCDRCGKPLEVETSYETKWCCSGFECGCFGLPINPVFCDDCIEELYEG